MAERLVFVLVDDNPDDRALVRRELEGAFPGSTILEASDQGVFEAVLQRRVIDVVITDYALRWSDGLKVLATARAQIPEAVVIMFTGTGSQELAVEAMKRGLDDYVIKGQRHLALLPVSVRSSLEKRELRRRAADLEDRHKVLFNRLSVGIFRADVFGRLLDANEAMLRILGAASVADAGSMPAFRAILWDGGTPEAMDLMREAGDQRTRRVKIRSPSGEERDFNVRDVVSRTGGDLFVDGIVEQAP